MQTAFAQVAVRDLARRKESCRLRISSYLRREVAAEADRTLVVAPCRKVQTSTGAVQVEVKNRSIGGFHEKKQVLTLRAPDWRIGGCIGGRTDCIGLCSSSVLRRLNSPEGCTLLGLVTAGR